MKKAFTLLELVFVIVVIGILAAAIIPNTKTNPVQEAAIQLVSHIRYMQHLAMMDDRFNATDDKWYMEMWQIRFTTGNTASDHKVAYVIYSDTSHGQHPEKSECAKDPLTGLAIDGGVVNNDYGDVDLLKNANLGHAYGIETVDFNSSCGSANRMAFDYMGRPIGGVISSASSLIDSLEYITETCGITISSATESAVIAIEPETGYTHILN